MYQVKVQFYCCTKDSVMPILNWEQSGPQLAESSVEVNESGINEDNSSNYCAQEKGISSNACPVDLSREKLSFSKMNKNEK